MATARVRAPAAAAAATACVRKNTEASLAIPATSCVSVCVCVTGSMRCTLLLLTLGRLAAAAADINYYDYDDNNTTDACLGSSGELTKYMCRVVLDVSKVAEAKHALAARIATAISDALALAHANHLQLPTTHVFAQSNDNISVQVCEVQEGRRRTELLFTTRVNRPLILAEVIVRDLQLLSAAHLSALLQYPVATVTARAAADDTGWRWWMLALIVGAGCGLLLLGWCILFLVYNTCGRGVYKADDEQALPVYVVGKEEKRQGLEPSFVAEPIAVVTNDPARSPPPPPKVIIVPDCEPSGVDSLETPQESLLMQRRLKEQQMTRVRHVADTGGRTVDMAEEREEEEKEDEEEESPDWNQRAPPRRPDRPRSAGRVRPRGDGAGDVVEPSYPFSTTMSADPWTAYTAGDIAARVYAIAPALSSEHPRPLPAGDGSISLRTSHPGPLDNL